MFKPRYDLEEMYGELCTCFHFQKDHDQGEHCMIKNCKCEKYYSQYDSMEH